MGTKKNLLDKKKYKKIEKVFLECLKKEEKK